MSDPLEDLAKFGITFGPDEGPTIHHKLIVEVKPVPNTRTGNICTLECGHQVMTFGNISLAGGKVLCQECRDLATPSHPCPACGHHLAFHNTDGCEYRVLQSGHTDFATIPKCGCKGAPNP